MQEMQVNLKIEIKGIKNLKLEERDHFEYDLKESFRNLLEFLEIDFEDSSFDIKYYIPGRSIRGLLENVENGIPSPSFEV